MFKNSYQSGLLSIFYSCGSDPLGIWDMQVKNGHVKRLMDSEINSVTLEIISTNVATTYITCPKDSKQVLGIRLPFLVMIVKNLKRYFSFEITILDDTNMRRRFRISNFQSTTKIRPFCTTMPIGLSGGWNQIQFNLADFTRRAYGNQFVETQRVQIHANVRLRRIYFADRLYTEEELPQEYKLYLPLETRRKKAEQKKELTVSNRMSKLAEVGGDEAVADEAAVSAGPIPSKEMLEAVEGETIPKGEFGEESPAFTDTEGAGAYLGGEGTEGAETIEGETTADEASQGRGELPGEGGRGEMPGEGGPFEAGEPPIEGETPAGGDDAAVPEETEAPPADADEAAEPPPDE